jgi:hypothetical protein
VLTEGYTVQIARHWNVPESGAGFVTRFRVSASFLARYEVHQAGDRHHREYWIPAEEVGDCNRSIVGVIEITRRFP